MMLLFRSGKSGMVNNSLHDIIQIEKEITERIDSEKKRAVTWQKQQREIIEQDSNKQLQQLRADYRKTAADIRTQAAEEAVAIVLQAEKDTHFLQELPDDLLKKHLWKALAATLGGTENSA